MRATLGFVCVCVLAAALCAQTKPRLIDDINELADGHHGDPASHPDLYPLTGSSFPDTPKALGNILYFTAHNSTGKRFLYRFASAVGPYANAKVSYSSPEPSNPRFLTLGLDADLLFYVADLATPGTHKLYSVDGSQASIVAFPVAILWSEIQALTATPDGLWVLATTKTSVNGTATQAIWRSTAGAALTTEYDLQTPRSEIGSFVFVPGTPSYFAFSCKHSTARALVVRQTTVPQEITIEDVNPVLLTPCDSALAFVDMAPYDSTQNDRLMILVAPAIPPVPLRSEPRIRNLVTTTVDEAQQLLFTANGTLVFSWGQQGLKEVQADSGTVTSIAGVVTLGSDCYVLGRDVHTTLWRHDPSKAKLTTVAVFPLLHSVHSLCVWGSASTPRFAFLGINILNAMPQIKTNSSGSTWPEPIVEDLVPGTTPDLMTRVGEYLFLRAHHIDRGCEPWAWKHQ